MVTVAEAGAAVRKAKELCFVCKQVTTLAARASMFLAEWRVEAGDDPVGVCKQVASRMVRASRLLGHVVCANRPPQHVMCARRLLTM